MTSQNAMFVLPFRDRAQAGQALAQRLEAYAHRKDTVVLALPRGGVPVGAEIATALGVPLHVFVVRKLGVPDHEELAMGAITSGGGLLINRAVTSNARIPENMIQSVVAREHRELARREQLYSRGHEIPALSDKTAILTDDGVATGSSMMAAVQALRRQGAGLVIVAVPVAPPSTVLQLRQVADDVVCLAAPEMFGAVGEWYEDFHQLTDHEVCQILDSQLMPESELRSA